MGNSAFSFFLLFIVCYIGRLTANAWNRPTELSNGAEHLRVSAYYIYYYLMHAIKYMYKWEEKLARRRKELFERLIFSSRKNKLYF